MWRRSAVSALTTLLILFAFPRPAAALSVSATAPAPQDSGPPSPETPPEEEEKDPYKSPWIDRAHNGMFNAVWRSAMRMDQWFGSKASEAAYLQTSGSIAPALLYDQFDGFQPKMRFQVDVPLPQLNERFHAFIG